MAPDKVPTEVNFLIQMLPAVLVMYCRCKCEGDGWEIRTSCGYGFVENETNERYCPAFFVKLRWVGSEIQ